MGCHNGKLTCIAFLAKATLANAPGNMSRALHGAGLRLAGHPYCSMSGCVQDGGT